MKRKHYHYWISFSHSTGFAAHGFIFSHKADEGDLEIIKENYEEKSSLKDIVVLSISELECDCDESN